MARAATLGRLTWQPATVAAGRPESMTARTLSLHVDGWTGHVPGQHVDVRLTASDGYSAYRSYSISSAPDHSRFEITVQAVPDGEVSPYLVEIAEPGDQVEIRGPLGGWFIRAADDPRPALLLGGGSGVTPLMSMVRAATAPTRLVYSARSPADALFTADLAAAAAVPDGPVSVTHVYTRVTPADWPDPPGRLTSVALTGSDWHDVADRLVFVCGPTGFAEAIADLLIALGYDPADIRTERFGPTGG